MQQQTIALQSGQRIMVAPVRGAQNKILLTVIGRDRQVLQSVQIDAAEAGLLAFALETVGQGVERAIAGRVQALCVAGEVVA